MRPATCTRSQIPRCNIPAVVTAHKDGYAEAAADIVLRGPATTLDLPMRRLAGRLDSATQEH